ncbi:hypothetical protein OGAPHI_004026 [Ogataea philodendri]|uniref:Uncharacterized protein n=1 Tax=Ogataea philodendri TaxID=1378263 RepID=A0A9P8T4D8_9ASCO|nr:uncharacterized protein OGAPHI_004026 [Ogataea philodendri]KAH3665838.1 hypothetical protein OGAPHI_004026 [Ogataea philodendri]
MSWRIRSNSWRLSSSSSNMVLIVGIFTVENTWDNETMLNSVASSMAWSSSCSGTSFERMVLLIGKSCLSFMFSSNDLVSGSIWYGWTLILDTILLRALSFLYVYGVNNKHWTRSRNPCWRSGLGDAAKSRLLFWKLSSKNGNAMGYALFATKCCAQWCFRLKITRLVGN